MSDSQDYGAVTDEVLWLVQVHGFAGLLYGIKAYAESKADQAEERAERRAYTSIAQQLDAVCIDAQGLEGM